MPESEPEEPSDSAGAGEELAACPVCGGLFPLGAIERHVEASEGFEERRGVREAEGLPVRFLGSFRVAPVC